MKETYMGLYLDSNEKVAGNMQWFTANRDRLYLDPYEQGAEWPYWNDGIVHSVPEADSFDKDIRVTYRFSFIFFFVRMPWPLYIIRQDFVEEIGRPDIEHSFTLFPFTIRGEGVVNDWVCIKEKKHARFFPEKGREDLRSIPYASEEYPLILPCNLYQKVRRVPIPDCTWIKIY